MHELIWPQIYRPCASDVELYHNEMRQIEEPACAAKQGIVDEDRPDCDSYPPYARKNAQI